MELQNIDFGKFQVIAPSPKRTTALAASALADGSLRLNSKAVLYAQGKGEKQFLKVSFWPEKRWLCLEFLETEEETATLLPKSGAIMLPNLKTALVENGVPVPAYFVLAKAPGGRLVGEHVLDHHFPALPPAVTAKRMRRPRKTDLAAMMPKEG